MSSGFKNTQLFPFPVDRHLKVASRRFHPFQEGGWRQMLSGFEKMLDFFKKPRITDACPTYHSSV